jgi:hypothetical protein
VFRHVRDQRSAATGSAPAAIPAAITVIEVAEPNAPGNRALGCYSSPTGIGGRGGGWPVSSLSICKRLVIAAKGPS